MVIFYHKTVSERRSVEKSPLIARKNPKNDVLYCIVLCDLGEIESEVHFVFSCPLYDDLRHVLFGVHLKGSGYRMDTGWGSFSEREILTLNNLFSKPGGEGEVYCLCNGTR